MARLVRYWRQLQSLSSPIHRFREQFLYGHREILLRAAAIDDSSLLLGRVQHGSDPLNSEGMNAFRGPLGQVAHQWVWSKDAEDLARLRRVPRVKAIGAPWLYLNRLEAKDSQEELTPRGSVFIPMHWDQFSDSEAHAVLAPRLSQLRDLDVTTVNLHGFDFLRTAVREAYEDNGLRVTCAGWPRDFPPPIAQYADLGDRAHFLSNLRATMLRHRAIVTDGFGTHILYAHTLGRRVFVIDGPTPSHSGKSRALHDWDMRYMTWIFDSFLRMTPACLKARAPYEPPADQLDYWTSRLLGTESFLSGDDLREALHWKPGVIPPLLQFSHI